MLCGHSADIVRTYISRYICPHYILLRFSPLLTLVKSVGILFTKQDLWSSLSRALTYPVQLAKSTPLLGMLSLCIVSTGLFFIL